VISQFIFIRTPKIYFGAGKFASLSEIISGIGKTVLIVTGAHSFKSSSRWDVLVKAFKNNSVKYFHFSVKGEPSPGLVDEAVSEFRNKGIDVVLAIGGGSAIDTGKAISAMFLQNNSVIDYLEGIGKGLLHSGVKVPFIAVPTTSGTGSEATKNAVLSKVGPDGFKRSLRHNSFVPDIALIDPELMISCPPEISSACGMDTFTQLLESYVSLQSTPLTDALAINGLVYLKDSLVPACSAERDNIEVRARMAYASLISGITLANAGLGIIHGLASAIGGFFNIPHGVICGTLAEPATKINIDNLRNKCGPESPALKKYAKVARLISASTSKDIDSLCELLIGKIREWTKILKIPPLSEYDLTSSDIDKIVEKARNKENPVKLGKNEIKKILLMRM